MLNFSRLLLSCVLTGAGFTLPVQAQAGCGPFGGEIEIRRIDGPWARAQFGWSVSDAGDLDGDGLGDIIVGAHNTRPGHRRQAGSAFVYSSATQKVLYRFDGLAPHDHLGWSVSGAGDVNGDGSDDVIVGAPAASPGGIAEAGSAFVFSGATGLLIHRFDGTAPRDWVGASVAGAGDVDGDDLADLIVGASRSSPGGVFEAGSVQVYSGANGALIYQFDGTDVQQNLGFSVSGAGDMDNDGFDDFMFSGPYGAYRPPSGRGSVFVHSGKAGTLLHSFFGTGPNDRFGYSISGGGDVDGDSVPDMVVGSQGAVQLATVYSGADGSPIYHLEGESGDTGFGSSVSLAGDVDGDELEDVIVGAPLSDRGPIVQAGSAHLFSGATGEVIRRFDGEQTSAFLGWSVSSAGDTNGDDLAEVLVGEVWSGNPRIQSGAAFHYSFKPFLNSSERSLSASSGGQISFDIHFPPSEQAKPYLLLASWSGVGPTQLPSGCIPLTFDAFTQRMKTSPPASFQGTMGTLSVGGSAKAILNAFPHALTGHVGKRAWFVALSLDLGSSRVRYVSLPVPLDVQL